MLGGDVPVEGAVPSATPSIRTDFVRRRPLSRLPCLGRAAAEADRQSGDRGLARREGRPQAGRFGGPVAGPLRGDRRDLATGSPPRGRDRRRSPAGSDASGADHADRTLTPPRRRPAPSRSAIRRSGAGEAGRIVAARGRRVEEVVEDEPGRMPHVRAASAGGSPHRGPATRREPARCWPAPRRRPRRDVSIDRLEMVGQVEAGRLALLRGDVADVHPRRRRGEQGRPDLGQEEARQDAREEAARADHDEVGLGDRRHGVPGRGHVLGRQPDSLDPARPGDLGLADDLSPVAQPGVEHRAGVDEAGTTRPRTARTRFIWRTPSSKSPPSTAVIAAMRRLPIGVAGQALRRVRRRGTGTGAAGP